MEDLDTPRTVNGAADDILRTLEAFGLHSDEEVLYQSRRTAAYEEELLKLINKAVLVFKNKKQWVALINHAMECNFSWKVSADKYVQLYAKAKKK